MLKTTPQAGKLVSFVIKKNAPAQAKELREITYLQPVNEETWELSNSLASLQAIHDIEKGDLPDINFLASMLFEAGRITGIREERARKARGKRGESERASSDPLQRNFKGA